jgi:starch-binding outer membrane protein, SusD/RagB family
MKKIFILLFTALATTACDVLNVESQSQIPAEDVFKDKSGIEKGILGSYIPFQYLSYYGRNFMIFGDLAADNLDFAAGGTSATYREIDNNAILPGNGGIDGIWSSAYEGLNIANSVIAAVPGISDMTDDQKNAALGELYFVRALNHFNLVTCFGAVPVKINPTRGTADVNVPRDPVDAVYNQIIEDLEFAALHLPESGTKVRATRFAAVALLARVYLYTQDYELAIEKATEVIEAGTYDLLTDYRSIFVDGSAESIFEIDFTELNRNRIAIYNFPGSLNGEGEVAPTDELIASYTPDDDRLDASIAFELTQPYAIKYDDIAKGEDNVIILRLAEMYLIRAEANAQLEQNLTSVQNDINEIRSRAGLTDTDATTYETLLEVIEKERGIEFAFEGHRWYDLVRTNRALPVLDNVTNVNQTLFPIPSSEILTNTNPDMEQNPGY